jgi:hypothetical protein
MAVLSLPAEAGSTLAPRIHEVAVTALIAIGIGLVVLIGWFLRRTTIRVPCTLDLERTHEHFHAHLELVTEYLIEPGDAVQIANAPSDIEYGTQQVIQSEAVVKRASWLRRQWTKLVGRLEFYELYDVGFE